MPKKNKTGKLKDFKTKEQAYFCILLIFYCFFIMFKINKSHPSGPKPETGALIKDKRVKNAQKIVHFLINFSIYL